MRRLPTILLCACLDPGVVEIQGVMVEGWEADAQPIGGATVRTLQETGEPWASTLTLPSGWYRVDAVAGSRTFIEVEGEGLETAAFSGLSGLNPRTRIPNGVVHAVSTERWEAERERWAGCPGLDSGEGVVFGRVLVQDFQTGDTGEVIEARTSSAVLLVDDGRTLDGCYLGEEGVYDPTSAAAGEGARFLIAGAPEGQHTLRVTWMPTGGNELVEDYVVWVPQGGLAPRFPLYVVFDAEDP